MDKSAKDIYKLIKRYDVITIYGHINPDCDSYGSTLGLRELTRLPIFCTIYIRKVS